MVKNATEDSENDDIEKKQTEKEMTGGDFGITAIILAASAIYGNIDPTANTLLTFLGTVTGDQSILSEGSIILTTITTLGFNIYSQGGLNWLYQTPLMYEGKQLLKANHLEMDIKRIISSGLILALDILFVTDKVEQDITTSKSIQQLYTDSKTYEDSISAYTTAISHIDSRSQSLQAKAASSNTFLASQQSSMIKSPLFEKNKEAIVHHITSAAIFALEFSILTVQELNTCLSLTEESLLKIEKLLEYHSNVKKLITRGWILPATISATIEEISNNNVSIGYYLTTTQYLNEFKREIEGLILSENKYQKRCKHIIKKPIDFIDENGEIRSLFRIKLLATYNLIVSFEHGIDYTNVDYIQDSDYTTEDLTDEQQKNLITEEIYNKYKKILDEFNRLPLLQRLLNTILNPCISDLDSSIKSNYADIVEKYYKSTPIKQIPEIDTKRDDEIKVFFKIVGKYLPSLKDITTTFKYVFSLTACAVSTTYSAFANPLSNTQKIASALANPITSAQSIQKSLTTGLERTGLITPDEPILAPISPVQEKFNELPINSTISLQPRFIASKEEIATFNNPSVFAEPNNIIFIVLELTLSAISKMVDNAIIAPIPYGEYTKESPQAKVDAVWTLVRAEYISYLPRISKGTGFSQILDFAGLFIFTDKIPDILKIILGQCYLYWHKTVNPNSELREGWKGIPGKMLDSFRYAMTQTMPWWNLEIIQTSIKNIKILLTHNTTVRIDRIHAMLREIFADIDSEHSLINLEFKMETMNMETFLYNLLQQITKSAANLQKFKDLCKKYKIHPKEFELLAQEIYSVSSRLYATEMTIKNRLLYPARGKFADAYRYATKKLGFTGGGGELYGGGVFDTIFGVINQQLNLKITSFNTILGIVSKFSSDDTIDQAGLQNFVQESKETSDQFVKQTTDLTNAISKEAEKLGEQNPELETDQKELGPSLSNFQQFTTDISKPALSTSTKPGLSLFSAIGLGKNP